MYAVRRPRPSDAPALFALAAADDLAEIGIVDYELADAVEELTRPGIDLDSDAWLATNGGRAVGYAAATTRSAGASVDAEVYVHPDAPDALYADLLARIGVRAAEHARAYDTASTVATVWAPAGGDKRTGRALRAAGWNGVRQFARMIADVGPGTVAPDPPDRVVVRAGADADETAVHVVLTEAFAEHFGSTAETLESWRERQQARAGYDRSLWLLAEYDGELAAALIGRRLEGLGWVQGLGVRRAFRGRGLGRLLLRMSFARFAGLGFPQVALGVDIENSTGALRLYESVGMRRQFLHDCYQLTVSAVPP